MRSEIQRGLKRVGLGIGTGFIVFGLVHLTVLIGIKTSDQPYTPTGDVYAALGEIITERMAAVTTHDDAEDKEAIR